MKLKLALAFAVAAFAGGIYTQTAEAAPGCLRACGTQYNLCLANTPHAAADCYAFYRACIGVCDIN